MRHPLAVILILAVTTGWITAQCTVDNPGGSKVNPNRPADADTPSATYSPLSYVNQELPSWICFTAGYRARIEGYNAANFLANSADSYLITRFRFGTLIRPTKWLRVYAEVQDATVYWKNQPLAPPYQSTWDLRRAYVDLGDTERDHFSLRVGRQDLNFGDGRLVGTSYWRNASRGYDAAMLFSNWRYVRISAFSASQVVVGDNGLSHHQPGNNLHGIDAKFDRLARGAVVEPYVFWRLTPGMKSEEAVTSKLDKKTVGVRWAGVVRRFDYDAEVAMQTGHVGADSIRTWAATAIAGYRFTSLRTQPRIFGEYGFASGDQNPKDGKRGTFDQLYPNVHDHHGLADQLAWQNLREVRAGVRISLRRNWTIAAIYNDWWLANATDAFYNSSGSVIARDAKGLSGTHIGEEYDAETSYRVNRQLEFGAGIGRILPGGFLARTGHDRGYTYPYLMMNYNFY
jgi:hypothetical protein